MVAHTMFRTLEGKRYFRPGKNPICDCSRSNQMPLTDQITEIAQRLRISCAQISELPSIIRTMKRPRSSRKQNISNE